jgi:hypothetical protein
VPPPIPIPAKTPPRAPAKINKNHFIITLSPFYCLFLQLYRYILSKNHFQPCKKHNPIEKNLKENITTFFKGVRS